MTTLTNKELAFLKALDDSEYGDEITDPIWTWNIADNIEGIVASSFGGIAASLTKKGLICCDEDAGDEACTSMTDEGAKLYIKKVGLKNLNKWHDEYAPVETMRPIWNARNNPEQAEEEAPETMTYGQIIEAKKEAILAEKEAESWLNIARMTAGHELFDTRTEQYREAAQRAIVKRLEWLEIRNDFESGK